MEAEALAAIFDSAYEIVSDTSPFVWSVKLLPVDCGGDEEEEDRENHVAVKLIATIPPLYPDDPPELDIEIIKGLADPQRNEILKIAKDEAETNQGMAAIFTICEAVREWLLENNVKGQDDGSMYAQMMRRAKEVEKSKFQAEQKFEAQKKEEHMTEAELEELTVRKRRAEGTPCTKESFIAWATKFEEEQLQKAMEEKLLSEKEASSSSSKKKDKISKTTSATNDQEARLTGFEQFSQKSAMLNLEDIEAAVAKLTEEEGGDDLDVDEDLFEDEDDLDDLDFDSDLDDSDEDEPDI